MHNKFGTIQLLDSKQLYIEVRPDETRVYDIRKAFPAEAELHYFRVVVFMANHLYTGSFEINTLIKVPLSTADCQVQEIYIEDQLVGFLNPLNGKLDILEWVNCIDVIALAYGDTNAVLQ